MSFFLILGHILQFVIGFFSIYSSILFVIEFSAVHKAYIPISPSNFAVNKVDGIIFTYFFLFILYMSIGTTCVLSVFLKSMRKYNSNMTPVVIIFGGLMVIGLSEMHGYVIGIIMMVVGCLQFVYLIFTIIAALCGCIDNSDVEDSA